MPGQPFALTTGDPHFDPRQPVTVNGFAFAPRTNPADRAALVERLETRARAKREDRQGFDAKLLEDAARMLRETEA